MGPHGHGGDPAPGMFAPVIVTEQKERVASA